ncbi:F-type H+-transporting ATPase subunit b [Litoreibacter ponti]|uniref:ATP synthase subunit b n=1 Tax=Litoreibacter ponti TaxID=1510457 RepID=A0A2T6BEB8_9RHOB|nr:F0F1 ATP synthase subunit B' [Litoreibacter ponti]PTX54407.1 F-type H+-transporting ATPase subunit b [Litoreibacter ponti]
MATETAEGAKESAGMPQLDFSTFDNQIVWLVITLVVIYFVLSRVALPRIGSVLAERAGTITNDIAAAEDLKQKAIEAEAAYDKALVDARAEAGRIVGETKQAIQADLDKAIAEADAEIAARTAEGEKKIAAIRESAAESAEAVAKDIAKDIVSAVSPTKVDAKTVTAAVSAKMKG